MDYEGDDRFCRSSPLGFFTSLFLSSCDLNGLRKKTYRFPSCIRRALSSPCSFFFLIRIPVRLAKIFLPRRGRARAHRPSFLVSPLRFRFRDGHVLSPFFFTEKYGRWWSLLTSHRKEKSLPRFFFFLFLQVLPWLLCNEQWLELTRKILVLSILLERGGRLLSLFRSGWSFFPTWRNLDGSPTVDPFYLCSILPSISPLNYAINLLL